MINFKTIAKKLRSCKSDFVLTVLFCLLIPANLFLHFIISDKLMSWSCGSIHVYLNNGFMDTFTGKLMLTISPWSWLVAFALFSLLAIISSIVYYKLTGKFYGAFVLFIFSAFVLIWQISGLAFAVYNWR